MRQVHVIYSVQFSCSVMSNSLGPHEPQHTRPPKSQTPPKPMSIESVMPSSHFILCRPLLLLPSIFPTIRIFTNESALHISFKISPSNEHPGLISFRMGCLDLLAVQGTLKSLLQHPQVKSINSSALSFLYSPVLTSVHDYWKNLRCIGFPFSVLRNH